MGKINYTIILFYKFGKIENTEKFKLHTGWEPRIPFEKTMGDLLEYWRGMVKKGRVFLTR